MLYMVDCAFSDSDREAAWNAYYTRRKLDEVLAVPGFRTSQRFKSVNPITAPYLAIHTVDSGDVLASEAYRSLGGGSFDKDFQGCITNWSRNLFSGLDQAPAIAEDELLAVADEGREALAQAEVPFSWLQIAGLDRSVQYRGIACVTRTQGERLAQTSNGIVRLYSPMMAQRVEPANSR